MVTLGNRLQAVRRTSGLTQKRLALALGVSKTSLRRWEQDGATPTVSAIQNFSSRCGHDAAVAKWIAYGGSAPTKSIAKQLDAVLFSVRERQKSKRAKGAA